MDTREIESAIEESYDAETFPCAVVSVEVDGHPRFFKAVGRPDPESGPEASESTVFDLASLTKPLATELLALRAVEAGYLSLDAPLSRYLPEAACASLGATIRGTMAHSAGYPATAGLMYRFPNPARVDREEAIAYLMEVEPEGPPGRRVVYSCTGFLLLGLVLERISGMRLSELFRRELAAPLGLSDGTETPAGASSSSIAVATFRPDSTLAARCAPTELCAWRGRRVRGTVHDESSYCLDGDGGNAGLFANITGVETLFRVWETGGGVLRGETVLAARALATAGLDRRRGLGIQLHDAETCDTDDWPDDSYGHTGFTGTCAWRAPASSERPGFASISLTNRVYRGRDATLDGIIAFRQRLHGAVVGAVRRA